MSDPKNNIKFQYIFDPSYNPTYVNGAHGGITPRGELVVNFYLERQPLPDSITHEITPNGAVGAETAVEPPDMHRTFARFVSSGVVLNYQSAKELHYWMGEKLKEMEAMEQARKIANPAVSPDKSRFSH